MIAITTFLVAFILLAMFIAFRAWEEKRHVRVWGKARAAMDEKVTEFYQTAVTGSIPRHYRLRFLAFLHNATHEFVLLLVAALRAVERPLTRISYRMRMAASNPNKKEVSSFLKTIAPEKDSNKSMGGKGAKTDDSI